MADVEEPRWYYTSLRRSGVRLRKRTRRKRMDRQRVMTAEHGGQSVGLIYRFSGAKVEAYAPHIPLAGPWTTPLDQRRQFDTIRQAQLWLWRTFQDWMEQDARRALEGGSLEARWLGIDWGRTLP